MATCEHDSEDPIQAAIHQALHALRDAAEKMVAKAMDDDPAMRAAWLQNLHDETEFLKDHARKAATHPEDGCDAMCEVEGGRPYCPGLDAVYWLRTLNEATLTKACAMLLKLYGDLLVAQDAQAIIEGATRTASEAASGEPA